MGKWANVCVILIGLGSLLVLIVAAGAEPVGAVPGNAAHPQAAGVGGDGAAPAIDRDAAAEDVIGEATVTSGEVVTVYLPLVAHSCSILPTFATVYSSPYSSDYAFAVQQAANGHYLVAGRAKPAGDPIYFDVWIMDLNLDGSIAWQKLYDGVRWNRARALQSTREGGYVVLAQAGRAASADEDVWVLKLDAGGNVTWQKSYGGTSGEEAHAIRQTADGGYVVAGTTSSFGYGGGFDAWALRLDAEGNVVWQKTFGEGAGEGFEAIEETADGGYVMAGDTVSYGAGAQDAWVVKLDAGGHVAWEKTYGGVQGDKFLALQSTGDGGYIPAGYTWSFGVGEWDVWVVKLGGDGNVIWQKTYGGPDDEYATAIQQTAEGDSIVVGRTRSFGAGDDDGWALKLDADGNVVWQKTYGGRDWDAFEAVGLVDDGGYVVTGGTYSFEEMGIWVLRLDADGGLCTTCSLGQPSTAIPVDSSAVVADSNVVRGLSNATVLDTDATTSDTVTDLYPICICLPSPCRQAY